MPFEDGAAQVIELSSTLLTAIPLAVRLVVVKSPLAGYSKAFFTLMWTLHAFVRDFVAQEDVVGVFPPAGVDEPKRCGSLAHENRDSLP